MLGQNERSAPPAFVIPSCLTGIDISLNAVLGSAPDDIWVAGDNGTILRGGPAGFLRQPVPTEQPLYGLWGFGRDDVWAVGAAGTIVHWDGQR